MQIRSLTRQIRTLVREPSEKLLELALCDKDLEQLAGTLNQYHHQQRQTAAQAIRHENYLKEAVSNISHDLRTPLTVILGHLQLLKKEALTQAQADRVDRICRKAERMKDLIKSFYDLSVYEDSNILPQKEKFNLSNLLMNLIAENAPALEAQSMVPRIHLPEHSVYLYSDHSMVERILQNLLSNALRYSSGVIEIFLSQKDTTVTFTIQNPVKGPMPADPEQLFARFYTGDRSRHSESTGLGLAVVRLLTQKLGGTVSASVKDQILSITWELDA